MLAPDFDSDNGEKGDYSKSLHAHMDQKTVKAAHQIVERKLVDEQDDCEVEQLNERITKMETMLKIIVGKLNDLVRKRRE